MQVLEAEGLIEVKRGSGTYVPKERPNRKTESELAHWLEQREETVEQVRQVRESIEGLTASLAAVRASSNVLKGIKAIYTQQMEKNLDMTRMKKSEN